MKRILITGITGYIGSRLAKELLPKYKVFGLVRKPLHLDYIAEILPYITLLTIDDSYDSVAAAVENCRPELVYHLAAYYTGAHSAKEAPALISSNITLGAYLLEATSANGGPPLVYASSVMAYYGGEAYRPLNLYAATKQAFSDILAYYTDAGLLRAVTLVLSDTYGPDDQRPKILNLIKQAAQTGERLALSYGDQDYDVVHISDVIRAFLLAGKQLSQSDEWHNATFQITSQQPYTLRQTVEKMLQINHLTLDAAWGERPSAKREIHRAVRLYPWIPGWRPLVPLEEGFQYFITGQEGSVAGCSNYGHE